MRQLWEVYLDLFCRTFIYDIGTWLDNKSFQTGFRGMLARIGTLAYMVVVFPPALLLFPLFAIGGAPFYWIVTGKSVVERVRELENERRAAAQRAYEEGRKRHSDQ